MLANLQFLAVLYPFLRHLAQQRARVLKAYAFSATGILLALAVPWPLKFLIDGVLQQQALPPMLASLSAKTQVFLLASLMFLLAMLAAVILSVDKVLHAQVREQFAYSLRDEVLQKIQRLSRCRQQSERSGELAMCLLGDVNQISRLFCKTLPLVIKHVFTALVALVSVAIISWPLGIIASTMAVALASLIVRFGPPLTTAATTKRTREGELAGLTQETVRGIEHVRAMALEQKSRTAYLAHAARSLHAGVEEVRVAVSLERGSQILAGFSVALIAGIGGYFVVLGTLSLGTLTVCLAYVTQLLKPIEKINEIAASVSRSIVRARRLQDLFQAGVGEAESSGSIRLSTIDSIECRNIAYRYPNNTKNTVSGLTHCFKRGECTAIVGPSGCGKSTLLRLLMRLELPTDGEITVNAVSQQDLDCHALRSQFAVLLQNSHLFAGSVRDILTELKPGATDSQLQQILNDVGLRDLFMSLPTGLDTMIDEAGDRLSGGQRTRLLLARALVSERAVIILDEPFANIDDESKRILIRRLAMVKTNIILIVVTHEQSLLEIADYVLTADDLRTAKASPEIAAEVELRTVTC